MKKIVNVVIENGVTLPKYETIGASGMDVRAFITSPIILEPSERILIPTGIKMEIPQGYEVQVRPRSGLALKHGITVLNAPGTLDEDFRGYIGVILINTSNIPYTINPGDKIAQFVLQKVEKIEFNLVEELGETIRNAGGFGHTGK